MKIVVGLGNPGSKYEGTRHNIGFTVVDYWARRLRIAFDQSRCDALVGQGMMKDIPVVLAKPQTFMNRSGIAVAALLQQYGASAAELVVIYDDLDLPVGRIRIRRRGSAGGHRGMSSIIEQLAATEFDRIRIGIGRPPEGVTVIDHVLARFAESEVEELAKVVERSSEALDGLLQQGVAVAMDVYNRAG